MAEVFAVFAVVQFQLMIFVLKVDAHLVLVSHLNNLQEVNLSYYKVTLISTNYVVNLILLFLPVSNSN